MCCDSWDRKESDTIEQLNRFQSPARYRNQQEIYLHRTETVSLERADFCMFKLFH